MQSNQNYFPSNRFLIICGGSGANLLGQLGVLGFNAELQIDASSEVLETKGMGRRFAIKLDEQIGAVSDLLFQTRTRVSDQPDDSSSIYLRQKINHPADVKHIKFLVDKWIGGGLLRDGMAAAPVIGGAAIKHPFNASVLRHTLTHMIGQYGIAPGPANPMEFWIVSSTAGGTGEGIHRFVGSMVAEVVRQVYPLTPVGLNFIRIGPMTYRSVHPLRTALNTLFGIAADAALERIFKYDFPNAVVNWFYLDLPDVGKDDIGKRVRAQLIEMASKSILLEDLSFDLKKLLVNNSGSHVVVAQTGFWGKDFGENVKYYETLKQVVAKVRDLIAPNPARFFADGQPHAFFDERSWEPNWSGVIRSRLENPEYLGERIVEGWRFPRYEDRDLTVLERQASLISVWNDGMRQLIGTSADDLPAPLLIERVSEDETGQEVRAVMPFLIDIGTEESLFSKIDDAHRAVAWCDRLLGTGSTAPQHQGLLKELHTLASALSRVMHPPLFEYLLADKKTQARAARTYAWNFLVVLTKVNSLIRLRNDAQRVLAALLIEPRRVLEFAQKELDYSKGWMEGSPSSPVLAADLSMRFGRIGGKSWLQNLDQAVQQGDRGLFRQEVLRGATGLTMAGLRSVLSVNPNADIGMIRTAINSSKGRMVTPYGVEYQGQWWQATPPAGATMQYDYRILPTLETGLEEQLRSFSGEGSGPTYIFTKLGVIGLYVLAFEAVSLNRIPGPDTTTAYSYLMRPIVQIVQDFIRQWANEMQTGRSGQFEIASAGVVGDPLDREVLSQGGLTESEIERIGEFYQFNQSE